jgi:hypothetical protein
METAIRQAQFIHHQRMQKSGKVRARRHPHARERLFDRAGAPHALPALEYQHTLSRARQVSSASKPIVAGTDHDGVPWSRSQF